ncbi:MAG: type II secretion system F family protein [Nocardioides sp.]|nr:type II secretion system F family protein [Nocardioides sp.]
MTGSDATVAISLVAGGQTLTADIFAPIRSRIDDTKGPAVPRTALADKALEIPMWAVYGGVGLLGVGLLGFLWILTLSMTRSPDLTPEARIVQYADSRGRAPSLTDEKGPDQALSQAKDVAAQMLSRNKSLEVRIARRLDAAGSDFKPAEWLLLHGGIVVAAGLLGLLIGGGSLVKGMLFLMLGLVLPWLWLGFKRKRRLKAFGALLPDTLQLMSGSLSAGLSLAQSVDTIVREGNEPMRSEFKRVLVETRLGVPLEDALEGITERFDSKDFAWVVMAIKIQRQVGGNLGELLNTVAGTIREREYLRRQVSTLSAEGRLSAWVLGLLPPLFGLYLFFTQPDYFGVMLSDPRGWVMLAGAAFMLGLGAFWMSRLVKVEV